MSTEFAGMSDKDFLSLDIPTDTPSTQVNNDEQEKVTVIDDDSYKIDEESITNNKSEES